MANKFIILALALTGGMAAVSAYAVRRNTQRRGAKLHKEDLQTWEGEGGKPASPAMHPAQTR
jgi:hypothetical protein